MATLALRSIRGKLWTMTAATVAVLGGAQCLGLLRLQHSVATITEQGVALRQNGDVVACQQAFARMQRWALDLAVSLQTQSEAELDAARTAFTAALAKVEPHHPDPCERLRAPVAAFDTLMLVAVEAYTEENRVLGNSKVAEARQRASEADDILTALGREVAEAAHATGEMVVASAGSTLLVGTVGLAGGVAAATVLALWLARSISRAVQRMLAGIQSLSRNDLTTRVDATSRDELGQMATSFTQAVTNLRELVQHVRGTADGLRERSTSVQRTAEQLAGGARDNAATTQEMSSTIHQITESIALVGKNASSVSDTASLAAKTATDGSTTVEQASTAMRAVHASSQKIGQITETMETIARQTNLLALNAAVEAARAGEAGRGFAVVAEEVRALASRASKAAAEIRETVHGITAEIARGVDLSAQANETLGRIRQEIGSAASSIAEIARATEEQGASTAEVGKAIQVVATNTQSVSGNSEELVRVAEHLLDDVTRVFTLIDGFTVAAPTATTAPTATATAATKATRATATAS